MKTLKDIISERLVLSKKSKDIFKKIETFVEDDQFNIYFGLSLDYFIGVDSHDRTLCYVEYYQERYGESFMLVILNDDIYLDLVKEYNLEEIEEFDCNQAPKELVEIVQRELDTELPVYISGVGTWGERRYEQIDDNTRDSKRYEFYIENVCDELR